MKLRTEEQELLKELLFYVSIYSVGLYVLDGLVTSLVFRSSEFWLPGGGILIAGAVSGAILAFGAIFDDTLAVDTATAAGGKAGPKLAIGIGLIVVLAAVVVATIYGAFLISHQNQDEHRALIFGFASALAWGLSVVRAGSGNLHRAISGVSA